MTNRVITRSVMMMLLCLMPAWCWGQAVEDQYAHAIQSYESGRYQVASEAFAGVADQFPETPHGILATFFRAESLVQLGDHRSALSAFRSFLDANPKHQLAARATFRLGETAFHLRQTADAIRWLEQFSNENPDDPLNEVALPYLGELRFKNNEFQLAEEVFRSALTRFPDGQLSPECRYGLAQVLGKQGRNDEALSLFEKVLDSGNPDLVRETQYKLGLLAWQKNEFGLARERFEAFVKLDKKNSAPDVHYWIARTWVAQQQPNQAIMSFRKVIAAGMDRNPKLTPAIEKAAMREGPGLCS